MGGPKYPGAFTQHHVVMCVRGVEMSWWTPGVKGRGPGGGSARRPGPPPQGPRAGRDAPGARRPTVGAGERDGGPPRPRSPHAVVMRGKGRPPLGRRGSLHSTEGGSIARGGKHSHGSITVVPSRRPFGGWRRWYRGPGAGCGPRLHGNYSLDVVWVGTGGGRSESLGGIYYFFAFWGFGHFRFPPLFSLSFRSANQTETLHTYLSIVPGI